MSSTPSSPPVTQAVVTSTPETVKLPQPQANMNENRSSYRVYKPSIVTSAAPPPPLPDDYFNPTAADLRAAQQTLTFRAQALTNAPLELRAVREAKEQAKRDRWPNTTIRIRFTDRTQLEETFPSTSKIRSVYAFVRNTLRDDVKPIKFILYQSPPKRDLKVSDPKVRDLSLAQLQLAPSSVLLLRFEDDALNGSTNPAPLLPNILSQAVDLPVPHDYDLGSTLPGLSNTPIPNPSSSSNSGEKKIPKWLKLGLKK